MTPRDDAAFDRLIERILDAEPCEWTAADLADDPRMAALKTLSDIAAAFRAIDAPVPARAIAFRWGPLEVGERVAEGGSAEVFRAHDPRLGRDVALKLLTPAAAATLRTDAFLEEARRLARIRDCHVVGVLGAAVHDGRAGLWCEWIDGCTLAERIARDGPLAADEAALVGIGLCRALAAVHQAGLLHGDVKPHNVLRERGGRLVLADLGAGGDPATVNASLRTQASPAWLAPEVLHGAARTQAHDLYALGGVLQFLLSGETPDPVRPGAAFDRSDVPPALRAVIARARAADPAARYATAGGMADALAACLHAPGAAAAAPASVAPTRRRAGMAAAVLALAIAAAGMVALLRAPPLPEMHLELLRHDGDRAQVIADGTAVALRDRLSFALASQRPAWVYVFNTDDHGTLQRLFPLPALDTRNPMPAGRRVELPGRSGGRSLRIEVSSPAQAEEFLVVASAAPVDVLETLAATDGATDAEVRLRGSGVLVPGIAPPASAPLDTLVAQLDAADQPLRLWRYRLPHRAD
ncbi:protein kinase domain-containing protein [Dokdonella koreensis]|uniref:Serine/threonine protein kinase n=1 Tax=Dokdonella koreensis DS-123 TaxID=1300342 RepID=A0A160DY39_9GAMM|nr:serine/threonine-protein kinase [Dokdonella koreensis]ANB19677.1 Serine/threonine protein kinase [Dokdonella koreensis DS-123]